MFHDGLKSLSFIEYILAHGTAAQHPTPTERGIEAGWMLATMTRGMLQDSSHTPDELSAAQMGRPHAQSRGMLHEKTDTTPRERQIIASSRAGITRGGRSCQGLESPGAGTPPPEARRSPPGITPTTSPGVAPSTLGEIASNARHYVSTSTRPNLHIGDTSDGAAHSPREHQEQPPRTSALSFDISFT